MSVSLLRRVTNRARLVLQGQASCFKLAISLVEGKSGLEIGGPSAVFRERSSPLPIYKKLALSIIAIFHVRQYGLVIQRVIRLVHKNLRAEIYFAMARTYRL